MKLERLLERLPTSNATRFAVAIIFMGVVAVLLWWRGPSFSAIGDAFTTVRWQWVAVGGRPQSRVGRRARDRVADGDPSGDAAAASRQHCSCSRRSRSGSSRTPSCPGRIGELARVAVLTRKLPKRKGLWATLVGTVFAHRVFDLVPVVLLIALRRRDGEDSRPGRSRASSSSSASASLLFTFAFVERAPAARREARPHGWRCAAS